MSGGRLIPYGPIQAIARDATIDPQRRIARRVMSAAALASWEEVWRGASELAPA